jgi:glutathione synthase|tara:strand:+ start:475 stop:1395 length:921 start_codon:yes stop_codon:yes gene_type:complete
MKMKILAIQGSSLDKIKTETDTTLFLALEAQKRKYKIFYFEPNSLSFTNNRVFAQGKFLKLYEKNKNFYKIEKKASIDIGKVKIVLIRNEPPFDQQYINTTYFLDHISRKVKIINNPTAVRNVAEKLFSLKLMKYMPPTLITENFAEIKTFFKKHEKIIIKPINSYSGNEVILLRKFNKKTIYKYIKKYNHVIFQKYLPNIINGDKRVFIINNKIKGCISRIPKKGSILSNMSKGAIAKLTVLTKKETQISKKVANLLTKNNIYFAGIDFVQGKLIGDINVTSPTGLKTHYNLSKVNLAEYFWDNI